jgi:large subunit ribosomal protein L9
MKILLTKDVKGQGKKGEIIDVSDGYAKNFLIKGGMGVVATADTINSVNLHEQALAKQKIEEKRAAEELARTLKGKTVTIVSTKGANGKLFGSITGKEIAEQLVAMGYNIDKKQIVLKDAIKQAGNYPVNVKVYAEVSAIINVVVE